MKQHYTPTPAKQSRSIATGEVESMFGVGLVVLAYVMVSVGAFKFGVKHLGDFEGTALSILIAIGLFKPTFKTVKALISSSNK